MNVFTVTFFGHRQIDNYLKAENFLIKYICRLLKEKEYVEFIVGRNGEFDQCVASSIRRVKNEFDMDNNDLVLMLPYQTAEFSDNKESFEKYYDSIYISAKALKSHSKASIQIRNREMVYKADLIICYIKNRFGGAYKAIEYAKKKNKIILNIADLL